MIHLDEEDGDDDASLVGVEDQTERRSRRGKELVTYGVFVSTP